MDIRTSHGTYEVVKGVFDYNNHFYEKDFPKMKVWYKKTQWHETEQSRKDNTLEGSVMRALEGKS